MYKTLITPLFILGLVCLTSCSSNNTPAEIAKPKLNEAEQKFADEATQLYSNKKIQKDKICEEFYMLQSDDKYNSWKQISVMLQEYAALDPAKRYLARHSREYYENQLTPYYERLDANGKYVEIPEEYFSNGEWRVIKDLEDFCNRL
jgi:hypothetical protein